MMTRKSTFLILFILAILISIFCFNNSRMPFIWLSLLWFAVAVFGAIFVNKTVIKIILLNIGVAIGVFGLYESYLLLKNDRARHLHYVHEYTLKYEKPLGYVPPRDTTLTDTAYWKDEQIYHVTYTLNSHGQRVVPAQHDPDPNADRILFFGGSIVFGQGVHDNETLPYFVGKFSHGKYHPYHADFIGYGAHQMLALLEHELEVPIVEGQPKFGVYLAIIDHINRARGRAFWDQHGPRYVLEPDGQVRFDGYFDDNFARNVKVKLREKSLFFRRRFYERITDDDINLFLGIIDKAKTIFERRYPGSKFYIILWDRQEWGWDKISEILQERFRKRNFQFYPIRNILQDFNQNIHKYVLHQHEGHPTPLTNQLMAEFVIEHILGK